MSFKLKSSVRSGKVLPIFLIVLLVIISLIVLSGYKQYISKARNMQMYQNKLQEDVNKAEARVKKLEKEDNNSDEYKRKADELNDLKAYAGNHQYFDGELEREIFIKYAIRILIVIGVAITLFSIYSNSRKE